MKTFLLPDLGEGLSEAEIVEWHVSEGDAVVADQPLLAVETDKAVVDVPSPRSGRIACLHAKVGDRVATGAPLVDFDDGARADTGTVAGELPLADVVPPAAAATGAVTATPKVRATPAVRAMARKMGVDLADVKPSGTDGSITAADLDAHAAAARPLHGLRRTMAQKMAQSHAEVVPATAHEEADVEGWAAGTDPTLRLIRAVAAACAASPNLNAWYDGESLQVKQHVDLGMAIDTVDGLLVPVLRDVGNRPLTDLRHDLDAVKINVVARRTAPADLKGATITLSNFGALGAGTFASMVVVPPQVAIVGAGRIVERVVAYEGKPAVRRMVPLSLTFDHRAVTGGEALRFLAALVKDLEAAR